MMADVILPDPSAAVSRHPEPVARPRETACSDAPGAATGRCNASPRPTTLTESLRAQWPRDPQAPEGAEGALVPAPLGALERRPADRGPRVADWPAPAQGAGGRPARSTGARTTPARGRWKQATPRADVLAAGSSQSMSRQNTEGTKGCPASLRFSQRSDKSLPGRAALRRMHSLGPSRVSSCALDGRPISRPKSPTRYSSEESPLITTLPCLSCARIDGVSIGASTSPDSTRATTLWN